MADWRDEHQILTALLASPISLPTQNPKAVSHQLYTQVQFFRFTILIHHFSSAVPSLADMLATVAGNIAVEKKTLNTQELTRIRKKDT